MLVLASIANLFPQPSLVGPGKQILKKTRFPFAFASAVAVSLRRMISSRGVAKKRRAQALAEMTVKSSPSVAAKQQSWRGSNHFIHIGCIFELLDLDANYHFAMPAVTGRRSIALMPGRLRHVISDCSTARVKYGR